MDYFSRPINQVLAELKVSENIGLNSNEVSDNRNKFGSNKITEKKSKTIVKRLIDALLEPMMLILVIAFTITLGINIGKTCRGESGDFYECIGIFIAIFVSVSITVIMEGKNEKAFKMLDKLSSQNTVSVMRNGSVTLVKAEDLVVGDIVYLEAGNKISADGRIISSKDFCVDESALTGESLSVKKDHNAKLSKDTPLLDRVNCVFSGTFCEKGSCVYVVTAVGDRAQIGQIAQDLNKDRQISAPLNEKLARLGKMVTIFGVISAVFVFILSFVRLAVANQINFNSVQNIFIEAIVLIVAAVPEGLPTTVAISLTLNVLKLAKSNALIRKLVATETVGCVSVICSDKTGTLTKNQMTLTKIVTEKATSSPSKIKNQAIINNIAYNSTAQIINENGKQVYVGNQTEICLLQGLKSSGINYEKIRKSGAISLLTPFSSQLKYMETQVNLTKNGSEKVVYLKGAPEVVLQKCLMTNRVREQILDNISGEQMRGGRVIAFASSERGVYKFDGFAVISDGLREDVKDAIDSCKKAGIKVKMLTGDNKETARNIAIQAGLSAYGEEVVTADYIESLSEDQLKERIQNITVIARSTPQTKLKVVKALQSLGEVVAVTGDGVNDAPAIKHADIGISMGSGSEITKQASDVVLLDNSFSTILKAITFGRNVYSNFQRFIMFQLTVNLASMSIIIVSLLMGLQSPFSSTCLLWLNIIMDGPLALSLGLEMRKQSYLTHKPVKRTDDILSTKILIRIALHSAIMCLVVTLQRFYNFLGANLYEQQTVIITMFVFFQVFNAINCREVTSQSAFKQFFSNKLLLIMIVATYLIHILIITFVPQFFGTVKLSMNMILKITILCLLIVAFSEGYKFIYRIINFRLHIKKGVAKVKKTA